MEKRTGKIISVITAVVLTLLLFASCRSGNGGNPVIDPERPDSGTGGFKSLSYYMTPKTDWRADWIWDGSDAAKENAWLIFRRDFQLETVPETMEAHISADSRYWLYVNGKNVVYEGGLKRGMDSESGYYDTVDIARFLKEGSNTLAIQVWYWGKDGSFSYVDSGSGGFLFEAAGLDGDGNETALVLSDAGWKVCADPAYLDDKGDKQPNYRIAEFNVKYDARKSLGSWEKEDFDDSAWENATVICRGGEGCWGKLYPRQIPFLKVGSLEDYENSSEFAGTTTKNLTYATLDLPYNAQCVPYLRVEAEAGKEIEITTENTALGSVITRYVTCGGEQEFESRGWFNGEHITYKIPAGVKIIALKYRESGYNTEFYGSFRSDDEFFDTLWQKSLRTLYVTMRDNFMDCPDRERAQWWGDVTNEMAMTMYSMDPSSYLLYRKGVLNMLSDSEGGVLKTVVPAGEGAYFELPMQQLAGICGFRTYYMYTGDREFVDVVYDAARAYLDLWTLGTDGLVNHRGGSWDWMDWGDRADVVGIENAWYFMALDTVRYFASIKGDTAAEQELSERMDRIYGAYQLLFTEKGFMGSVKRADDRANALAVLSGLADLNDPDQFNALKKVLTTVYNSSPYMERYVLDALCEMGLMEEAQARVKKRYKGMVEEDYSTLWEYWDKGAGTMNHAWSGGPLLTMSQYMAGVSPVEPGYAVYSVKPSPGSLKSSECTVPSIKGPVNVTVRNEEVFRLDIDSPAGTAVIAGIPRTGSQTAVYYDGTLIFSGGEAAASLPSGVEFYGFECDRICFKIETGEYRRTLVFEAKEEPSQAESGKVRINVIPSANGSVKVNGEIPGSGSGSGVVTVNKGDVVKLEAVPASGYEFAFFTGSAGGRERELELTAEGDMAVGAEFTKNRTDYSVLSLYVPDGSDVELTADGKNCVFKNGQAGVIVPTGSKVTVIAADGILETFLNYSGDYSGTDRTAEITVDRNISVMVNTSLLYGKNVAQGARATCSRSMESGSTWSVSNLTDGNTSTGFTTEVLKSDGGVLSKSVVINLDLGSVKEFSVITLYPRTDTASISGGNPCFPEEFTLKVSRGGSDYTDVGTFTFEGDPAGRPRSFAFETVKARYVRLEITRTGDYAADEAVADPYRVQIMEIMLRDKK
jgi:hypothetical protein